MIERPPLQPEMIQQLQPDNISVEATPKEIKSLPPTKLNLGNIKGYNEKKKTLKLLKLKQDVAIELRAALDIFDPDEINLNHTAVLFCCQIVEDIFTKSKQGDLKKDIVVDVCKKFFNNDTALVEMVIELVFEKIIKTTLFRRNKEAIKNALSWLLNMVGMKVQPSFSTNLKI